MEFLELGQIPGAHHKTWVLDQVARVLSGTPVIVSLARWGNGHSEYRFATGEPSQDYLNWVEEMRGGYNPATYDFEYDYDVGTAP